MNRDALNILFPLLRTAVCGKPLTQSEVESFDWSILPELFSMTKGHDVSHMLVLGLEKNGLFKPDDPLCKDLQAIAFRAVMRSEQQNHALETVSQILESAEIEFIPLKGSVLKSYYPEQWMRTSCDIDVLVHKNDLERAIKQLSEKGDFTLVSRSVHDVSLISRGKVHIELHFDLVEEGRANRSSEVLQSVWEHSSVKEGSRYCRVLSDAMFHFYHVAHMAKHFEKGGCGIRTFIDLWILDNIGTKDQKGRDELLKKGELLRFYEVASELSRVWLESYELSPTVEIMQEFVLNGGSFGSAENRVVLQQRRKGGRLGYVLSRMFIPYHELKRYYPILEKRRWLMPIMQVRRWGMLFKPEVAQMAKSEIAANTKVEKDEADKMTGFLKDIGL